MPLITSPPLPDKARALRQQRAGKGSIPTGPTLPLYRAIHIRHTGLADKHAGASRRQHTRRNPETLFVNLPVLFPFESDTAKHLDLSSSKVSVLSSIFILLFTVAFILPPSTLDTNWYRRHPHETPPGAALLYRSAPPQKAVLPHASPHFFLLLCFPPFFSVHHQGLPPPKPQFEALAIGRTGRED